MNRPLGIVPLGGTYLGLVVSGTFATFLSVDYDTCVISIFSFTSADQDLCTLVATSVLPTSATLLCQDTDSCTMAANEDARFESVDYDTCELLAAQFATFTSSDYDVCILYLPRPTLISADNETCVMSVNPAYTSATLLSVDYDLCYMSAISAAWYYCILPPDSPVTCANAAY